MSKKRCIIKNEYLFQIYNLIIENSGIFSTAQLIIRYLFSDHLEQMVLNNKFNLLIFDTVVAVFYTVDAVFFLRSYNFVYF